MKAVFAGMAACIVLSQPVFGAEAPSANLGLLNRRYRAGEKLSYRMIGVNRDWHYEIRGTAVVKERPGGGYFEEYAWSDLKSDGRPVVLPPASAGFRQAISLDPGQVPTLPSLAGLSPMLIGPITDLMGFYCDLWLAIKTGKLTKPGDRAYFANTNPDGVVASWADGQRVVLGEDAVDFDLSLEEIDLGGEVATLKVRHVPPKQPRVKLPATWMSQPVADTPNNWVQVSRKGGGYTAAVGQETFEVRYKVSLADGKILSATMDNPVITRERDCKDAALTECGDPRDVKILRQIQISLE